MKVCMVTTAYPRWPGDGDGAFIHELCKAILQGGHTVKVVAMHAPGLAHHELIDGVSVHRPLYLWPPSAEGLRKSGAGGLPVTWRLHPWSRWQVVPFLAAHGLASLSEVRNCDIVHAHWTLSGALMGLLQPIHRRPVVTTLHGTDVFQAGRYALGSFLLEESAKRSNHVTVVSRALGNALGDSVLCPVSVIPNGVDTVWFSPPDDLVRDSLILYVGSLIERKGVKYLVEALHLLDGRLADYQLAIVGDGPLRPELEILAHRLGVSDRVGFLGAVSRDDVREHMRRARLLVLPSVEEGMGVVLIEAMACGTPVIGSDVGGISEVIDNSVGRVFPVADPVAIAGAIEAILLDEQYWARMSRAARRRAESQYSWDRVVELVLGAYNSAIDDFGRGEGQS